MLRVHVVVGNPKAESRTAMIATRVAEALAPAGTELSVIDLANHANRIFDWPSDEMSELNDAVAGSDLLIVASPTYKASYTGLLKAFFDRYPNLGLDGVVAVPVMTGGDPKHAMGLEMHLRPLLVELGAVVPTSGLYFLMSDMAELTSIIEGWVAGARTRLSVHLPAVLEGVREHTHS